MDVGTSCRNGGDGMANAKPILEHVQGLEYPCTCTRVHVYSYRNDVNETCGTQKEKAKTNKQTKRDYDCAEMAWICRACNTPAGWSKPFWCGIGIGGIVSIVSPIIRHPNSGVCVALTMLERK